MFPSQLTGKLGKNPVTEDESFFQSKWTGKRWELRNSVKKKPVKRGPSLPVGSRGGRRKPAGPITRKKNKRKAPQFRKTNDQSTNQRRHKHDKKKEKRKTNEQRKPNQQKRERETGQPVAKTRKKNSVKLGNSKREQRKLDQTTRFPVHRVPCGSMHWIQMEIHFTRLQSVCSMRFHALNQLRCGEILEIKKHTQSADLWNGGHGRRRKRRRRWRRHRRHRRRRRRSRRGVDPSSKKKRKNQLANSVKHSKTR